MTLCIAAICNDVEGQDAKIVLCSDWERSLPGTGSSETADKIGLVKTGWPVGKFGPREIKKEIEFNPDFLESF